MSATCDRSSSRLRAWRDGTDAEHARTLRLAGMLDGRRAFTGPRHVQVDPTNGCNSDCLACWAKSPMLGEARAPREWDALTIPTRFLLELVDDLADMGCELVHFAGGGDPFFHPSLLRVIARIRERGMQAKVTSNFSFMNARMIEAIADVGLDFLTVSVWAATERTYKKTHPGLPRGEFDKLKDNLRRLNEIKGDGGPEITCYNVMMSLNLHEVPDMADFAADTGCERLEYQVVDPVEGYTERLCFTDEQAARAPDLLAEARARLDARAARGETVPVINAYEQFHRRLSGTRGDDLRAGSYDRDVVESLPCRIGWNYARITADGLVGPCLKGDKKPMGSLYEQRFADLWYGEAWDEFRRMAASCSKHDPYFATFRCHATCDNLGDNLQAQADLDGLGRRERAELLAVRLGERAGLGPGGSSDPVTAGREAS